jgi:hypothetical protein
MSDAIVPSASLRSAQYCPGLLAKLQLLEGKFTGGACDDVLLLFWPEMVLSAFETSIRQAGFASGCN